MEDPYVYPGTQTLLNLENIRDAAEAEIFERVMTANRLETLPSLNPASVAGYKQLHRYIFQDVYAWAGRYRTVDIGKSGYIFCRPAYIEREMTLRFSLIRDFARRLHNFDTTEFVRHLATHVCELNAIHPFREGNGRTLRGFIEYMCGRAQHPIDLARLDRERWIIASIGGFRDADHEAMCAVLWDALV